MHTCFKLAQCFFVGTFILVGIMLAITPKQQRWIWVLTDFHVRQLLLSCHVWSCVGGTGVELFVPQSAHFGRVLVGKCVTASFGCSASVRCVTDAYCGSALA